MKLIIKKNTTIQISNFKNYKPTIICGPSGVGKGTLLQHLIQQYPSYFSLKISHTSRQPRPGEMHGVHYHFVEYDEFVRGIENEEFVEHAKVHGNYYGTHKNSVHNIIKHNKIGLLELDIMGAVNMKNIPNIPANYLFIDITGGLDTLQARLLKRGTESKEQIDRRLQTAKNEYQFLADNPAFFDYILKNDDLELAKKELISILQKWYPFMVFS